MSQLSENGSFGINFTIILFLVIVLASLSWYILRQNVGFAILWTLGYALLLLVWYLSTIGEERGTTLTLLPGFNVLFIINVLLNFAYVYVFHTLQDPKTAFIINILLVSSSIGILLQLPSRLKLIFGIYLLWTVFLLFRTWSAWRQQ